MDELHISKTFMVSLETEHNCQDANRSMQRLGGPNMNHLVLVITLIRFDGLLTWRTATNWAGLSETVWLRPYLP